MHSAYNRRARNRCSEALEIVLSGWVCVIVAVVIFVWCIFDLSRNV